MIILNCLDLVSLTIFANRFSSRCVTMTRIWVSKWVDNSLEYGFDYQLYNDGMGVMFNDTECEYEWNLKQNEKIEFGYGSK